MKYSELWGMGTHGFFGQLSDSVRERLTLSWQHMMAAVGAPIDENTQADIFSNAGQLHQGVVELCPAPPDLLDVDVSAIVNPDLLDAMTADEMAEVLIGIYERHI